MQFLNVRSQCWQKGKPCLCHQAATTRRAPLVPAFRSISIVLGCFAVALPTESDVETSITHILVYAYHILHGTNGAIYQKSGNGSVHVYSFCLSINKPLLLSNHKIVIAPYHEPICSFCLSQHCIPKFHVWSPCSISHKVTIGILLIF